MERKQTQNFNKSPLISRSSSMSTPEIAPINPKYTYSDVGGLENQKMQLKEIIGLSLKYEKYFNIIGTRPPSGILLHGPSGCGKSLLVEATAGEFIDVGVKFFKISGADLLPSQPNQYGQSDEKIRSLFSIASSVSPSIIFIDDIDTISQRKGENVRILSQLTQWIDATFKKASESSNVFIIACTNKLEKIDSSLRRPGRFTFEIPIGIPDLTQRLSIIQVIMRQYHCSESIISNSESFESNSGFLVELAHLTDGFIGLIFIHYSKNHYSLL